MMALDFNIQQSAQLVGVRSTSNRGFTPEELAAQCAEKLLSISTTAPPEIRDQALAFQSQITKLVEHYLKQAVLSDRTTVYNALTDAGHLDLAQLIRKL